MVANQLPSAVPQNLKDNLWQELIESELLDLDFKGGKK